MTTMRPTLDIGDVSSGYEIRRREHLPPLEGTYLELVHRRTGARHMHIACGDDNNVFAVMFPTIPQDSTGVAHILEHIVLCGSRRFPVRDPFFAMLPRSLSTFMNALTSSAWTCYPFATRNEKDFFNLLAVYLDACFFPLIDRPSFLQEAHRFEFSDPTDPTTPLAYKGVVFNEMKGAMASAPARMGRAVGEAVFPDLTYANNSGGDPRHIPDLTHDALRRFHAEHYHPSNAHFYTYGSLPLQEVLARIDAEVMSHFEPITLDTRIPDQPRVAAPRRFEAAYPLAAAEDNGRKCQVLIAWLTSHVADSFTTLALHVLSDVLLANSASPLRRALIESQIGTALADDTGFDDGSREAVFAAGLKDVAETDADRVEALVLDVLRELATAGIDEDLVEGAVHRAEIANREVSHAGIPYGLKVLFRGSGAYLYEGDPYRALLLDRDLERLAAERASGRFFERLIQHQLLENPHRVRILLRPDPELTARDEAEEAQRLARVRERLSQSDVDRIVAEAEALRARQESPGDVSCLPTLALSDVPVTLEDVPHRLEPLGQGTIGLFPQPTNGLTYVDVQLDASRLDAAQLDLLPVFAFVAPKLGAGASDYLQMASRINRYTGGVSASAGIRVAPDSLQSMRLSFAVSGYSLFRNHAPFLEILHDILVGLTFDPQHLANLLGQYRAGLESRIVPMGHMYSIRLADAQLSPAGGIRERLSGLSQLAVARRLAALDADGLAPVIAEFEALRDALFRGPDVRVCVTSEESELVALRDAISPLVLGLPQDGRSAPGLALAPTPRQPVARTTSVPVAYDARVFPTVPFTHADAPALSVLGNFLRATHVHREVREKGGAYGGRAMSSPDSGLFVFMSYRDPHVVRTFRAFDEAVAFVLQGGLDERAVTEAILESSGDADPLLSPDMKGRDRFFSDLAGYTLPRKEAFKRGLLAVKAPDLVRVADAYLRDGAAMAVIGGEEKIASANEELGGIFEVAPV